MTPVFCCGFECGVTSSSLHIASTQGSYSTSTVRSGARSHRFNPTAITNGHIATIATLSTSNKWVIRCYVNFATLPSADCLLLYVTDGTTKVGVGFKQSNSKIDIGFENAGLFIISSSGVSVTTGVWYRIDFKVDLSANPWTYDGKVDGVTLSTPNTAATAAATPANFSFGVRTRTGAVTADVFFDDLLASNTLADFPLGAGYVNHFVPTADGTHNIAGTGDFQHGTAGADIVNATTDAFSLVDDVPLPSSITTSDLINLVAPPNATDYVECVFGPASGISTPTTPPRMVDVVMAFHQAGTGAGNMEVRLNDNGSTGVIYTATGVLGVLANLLYARAGFSDPPSAASAWTLSGNGNFNNVRMRFGSPAAVDANPDQYLDAIMIEAEFQEIAAIPNKIVSINQSVKRASSF